MSRRRSGDVERVRVPDEQAPLFHVPGPHGGWFVSLLYGFGTSVDVPMQDLRKLVANSRGEVIIARRITPDEQERLESDRGNADAGTHAWLVAKEELRFRRPGRGSTSRR